MKRTSTARPCESPSSNACAASARTTRSMNWSSRCTATSRKRSRSARPSPRPSGARRPARLPGRGPGRRAEADAAGGRPGERIRARCRYPTDHPRRRARRQPLVHREPWYEGGSTWQGEEIGPVSTRTTHAVERFPPHTPSANGGPATSPPAPTATSGSPSSSGNRIGRITPAGVVTEFERRTAGQRRSAITAGPRRQPLVHRVGGRPDRPDHADRRRHRVPARGSAGILGRRHRRRA